QLCGAGLRNGLDFGSGAVLRYALGEEFALADAADAAREADADAYQVVKAEATVEDAGDAEADEAATDEAATDETATGETAATGDAHEAAAGETAADETAADETATGETAGVAVAAGG